MPYTVTLDDFKTHVRTFRSVFPHVNVVLSPVKNGAYLLGSDKPMAFDQGTLEKLLGTAQARTDLATAPDDLDYDGATWARQVMADDLLHDAQVDEFVGPGPVITDDHPISEYWLLRVYRVKDHGLVTDERIRAVKVSART
jgi:hypothetical protein